MSEGTPAAAEPAAADTGTSEAVSVAEATAPAPDAKPETVTTEALLGDAKKEEPAPVLAEPEPEPAPEPKEPALLAEVTEEDQAKEDAKVIEDGDIPWYQGITDPAQEKYWSRFKTMDAAMNAHMNMVKMQGDMIKMPDKMATDDEMERFYDKMGRPKSPDDYKLDRDFIEGLDDDGVDRIKGFLGEMHTAGARDEVVQAAVSWFNREADAAHRAEEERVNHQHKERLEALRLEWPGNAYSRNVDIGIKAFQNWVLPDEAKELASLELADGTQLGKYPAFVKAWYNVGLGMEDATSPVSTSGGLISAFSNEEILQMKSDAMEKGLGTPEGMALHKKAQDAIRANLEREGKNTRIGSMQTQSSVR